MKKNTGYSPKRIEEEIYNRHAEMCKVFSNPKRLEIINILREMELTVSEIAEKMGISIGNLSQHLIMMKQRGVLDSRKEGNNVYYFLANPKMVKAFDIIREVLYEQIERNNNLVQMSKELK